MNEAKLKKLLNQGEQAAQHGDWSSAKNFFQQAASLAPQDLASINGLASSLIQLGNAEEAIEYFEKVIALTPQSTEGHNNLGVGHLICGHYPQAEEAFRQAIDVNPDNVQAWKNLSLACLKQNKMEEGVQILASIVKTHPKDVEALYLLGQCYQEAEEFESAKFLYEQAAKIAPEFTLLKDALASLPGATVDPTRIARAEHAQKLSALKGIKKVRSKSSSPSALKAIPSSGDDLMNSAPFFTPGQSLAFFGLPELPGGRRVELLARLLSKSGHSTKFAQTVEPVDLEKFDCFIFSQPHISSDLINGVMACIQADKRFVVDIDQDYHAMPEDHPAYAQFGQGNATAMKALKIMLQEAEWVSAPSSVLAERMAPFAKAVKVILPMWDQENPLWNKSKTKRTPFNLGWIGTMADRADLITIKSTLEDCIKNIPQAQLVIAGDSAAYELFDGISESRRLFLPAANPEDIPYVLSQFDILLIPFRDNLFNQAKSDLALLEAGVLRIPWVATPIQSYKEWGEGGIFAETAEEWCEAITRLVNDEKLGLELGEKGRVKAEDREKEIRRLIL
jgi:Flp pilus assembly protein TadD